MFYTASFVSLPETDTQGKAQRCHFHVPYRTCPRVAGIVGFTLWRIACIVAPGFRHPLRARNRSDYEDINSVQDPISGNIIAGEYYRAGSNSGTVA